MARKSHTTFRTLMLAGCASLALGGAALAQGAKPVHFDIPAEDLGSALNQLAQQSQREIVFNADVARGKRSAALRGDYTAQQALEHLLAGTGLRSRLTASGSIVVEGVGPQSAGPQEGPAQSSTSLSEVVVTAQKRSEHLQDVPGSVSVVDTDALSASSQTKLADYFASVPGLGLDSGAQGGGTQYITIRGLSTGDYANPTVAYVIDDVPFGSSSVLGFGYLGYPDIDPGDLAHIEVLKGPQGTLYGANAMGGLIKIDTKDPSFAGFSGHLQVQAEDVPDGAAGYSLRGSANIPVTSNFAIRVSGFSRRDPGYIDNITTGQANVNFANVYGGRIAALWRPTENLSIKVGALLQNTDGNAAQYVDMNAKLQPVLGDLKQTGILDASKYNTQTRFYDAVINYNLAGVKLTSVTGYGMQRINNGLDYTAYFGGLAQALFGTSGSVERQSFENDKFTEEFRASTTFGNWLDVLAGAFYTHETNPRGSQTFYATDPSTGAHVGTLLDIDYSPSEFREYAVFGDLDIHLTDQFDVQFGGRESWDRQTADTNATGPLTPIFFSSPSPYHQIPVTNDSSAFTYLVTPRFKITPALMVYARVATGYRLGGPNSLSVGVPASYAPDRTTNFEVGVKSDIIPHKLTIDGSAYYIDWKNIQLGLFNPTTRASYVGNGGNARSDGIEVTLEAHPLPGTTVTAQTSISDAKLTQDLPTNGSFVGFSGDRLPYSARVTGGVTLDQVVGQFAGGTVTVGGSVNYVGDRLSEFSYSTATPRLRFPAYTAGNVHAEFRADLWDVNFFVNNVGNKRGIIGAFFGASAASPGEDVSIIQPRTIGVSVTRNF